VTVTPIAEFRLNKEINAANPKMKARLASRPETEKWAKVIRAANIKPAPAAGNLLDRPGYEKVDEREGQQLISDRALNIKPVVKLALFRLRPLAEFRKRGQS
jgi:hypothetical protein